MAAKVRTGLPGYHFGRGQANIRRRLKQMLYRIRQGHQPTVSQLGAAYVAMLAESGSTHPDSNWGLLLLLVKNSRGTVIDCYNCTKGYIVKFVRGVGWVRKECPRCAGNIRVSTHGFAPGDAEQMVAGRYGMTWRAQVERALAG